MLIHTTDLERLLPRWIELTSACGRRRAWESDMYALLGAVAETASAITVDRRAWMNWPEEVVAGAPIIHYCQTVEAHDGEPLVEAATTCLGTDRRRPDEARLDYCRDLLAILTDVVRSKARDPLRQVAPRGDRHGIRRDAGVRVRMDRAGRPVEAREPP